LIDRKQLGMVQELVFHSIKDINSVKKIALGKEMMQNPRVISYLSNTKKFPNDQSVFNQLETHGNTKEEANLLFNEYKLSKSASDVASTSSNILNKNMIKGTKDAANDGVDITKNPISSRLVAIIIALLVAAIVKSKFQKKSDFNVKEKLERNSGKEEDVVSSETSPNIKTSENSIINNELETKEVMEFKRVPYWKSLGFKIYIGLFIFFLFVLVAVGTPLSFILFIFFGGAVYTFILSTSHSSGKYNRICIYPDKIILSKDGSSENESISFSSIGKVRMQSNLDGNANKGIRKEFFLLDKNDKIITTLAISDFQNGNDLKNLIFKRLNIRSE
jgi:hypothetical protein